MFDEGDGGKLWFHRANTMELFVFAVETAIFFLNYYFYLFPVLSCHEGADISLSDMTRLAQLIDFLFLLDRQVDLLVYLQDLSTS